MTQTRESKVHEGRFRLRKIVNGGQPDPALPDYEARQTVAECWTCMMPAVYGRRQWPMRITFQSVADACRAAGHDVREVRR